MDDRMSAQARGDIGSPSVPGWPFGWLGATTQCSQERCRRGYFCCCALLAPDPSQAHTHAGVASVNYTLYVEKIKEYQYWYPKKGQVFYGCRMGECLPLEVGFFTLQGDFLE